MKCTQKNFLAKYVVLALLALGSSPAFAGVFISVDLAPPPLPVYEQPACPDDGYIWTPGYWAYGDYGYYWVPGAWVQPPQFGLFWTPPYWGWGGNAYRYHSGYWGQNVGFYGGINYGYGYGGNGYGGGRWQGRHFFYNTAVNNVGSTGFAHTYRNEAVRSNAGNVSYNGGRGGVQAQPTAQQRQFSARPHVQPTSLQQAQIRAASQDRAQLASVNGGRPATLAAARPQAYTAVAQQHAKAQPLTSRDRTAATQAVSAKSNRQASSTPRIEAAKPTHLASQKASATATHAAAVKPQPRSVAHTAPLPRPATHLAQPRSVTHAAPRPHPVAHAAPQAHPVAHAAPRPRPAVHAKA